MTFTFNHVFFFKHLDIYGFQIYVTFNKILSTWNLWILFTESADRDEKTECAT